MARLSHSEPKMIKLNIFRCSGSFSFLVCTDIPIETEKLKDVPNRPRSIPNLLNFVYGYETNVLGIVVLSIFYIISSCSKADFFRFYAITSQLVEHFLSSLMIGFINEIPNLHTLHTAPVSSFCLYL